MILLKSLIARFDTLTVPRALRGTDSRLPIAALLTIALLGTGCVAGKAFRQGEAASQAYLKEPPRPQTGQPRE